jgi:endogenous inhibitor of DNA gyrase (YacG/DUF329 family)
MKPEEYFPRPPGEEPFLPPFTNAIKPEKKMVKRICAKCHKVMGEVEAVGSDKSEGLCPECGKGYYWEKEGK